MLVHMNQEVHCIRSHTHEHRNANTTRQCEDQTLDVRQTSARPSRIHAVHVAHVAHAAIFDCVMRLNTEDDENTRSRSHSKPTIRSPTESIEEPSKILHSYR